MRIFFFTAGLVALMLTGACATSSTPAPIELRDTTGDNIPPVASAAEKAAILVQMMREE